MKDIDIIKGIQYVGDDLITRAEDYSPIPKRSIKGYVAAAACMLLVIAVIPVVIVKLNSVSLFSSSVERLDADKYGRTFYNMWYNEENKVRVFDSVNPMGTIHFTANLEKVLEMPHEEQDCFAVTVKDTFGADLNEVYEKFTAKYDVNDIAKNDSVCPTIYVTEEQLRSMEPVDDMYLTIDSVRHGWYLEQYWYEDYEGLTNEKFTKFYGEVHLNYNSDDAIRKLGLNPDETSSEDPAVLAELERYYRKFASDYGIDPDKLFAGGVTRTLAMYHCLAFPDLSEEEAREKNFAGYRTEVVLFGEFETAAAERMIRDKRVQCILKTSNNSYIYEERGLWSYPTRISAGEISEIPAGIPYGEIVEKLGHTAQYGENSLHVYLVGSASETVQLYSGGLIILDFDDPNELCPYSGYELLKNAVSLENLDTIRYAQSDSRYHTNAVVLKEDLALVFYRDRIKAVRLGFGNVITNEISALDLHYDKNGNVKDWFETRPADEREVFRHGAKLYVTALRSVNNLSANDLEDSYDYFFPVDFDVKSIVILP